MGEPLTPLPFVGATVSGHPRIVRLKSLVALVALFLGGLTAAVGAQIAGAPAAKAADVTTKVDEGRVTGLGAFEYGAGWGTAAGVADFHQGTVHYATGTATATFTFLGTNVRIIAGKDVDQGIARYSVDGSPATEVSHYSTTRQAQSVVFDSGALPVGVHTVTITATGTKHAQSLGTVIALDAAEFTGPELQNFDDGVAYGDVNSFAYGAGWGTASGVGDLHEGTAHYTNGTGTTTFTFSGQQAVVMGVKDRDQGRATYSVDGGAQVTVDHYRSTRNPQAVLFSTGRLPQGTHTVTIRATGTKNAASTNTTVALDYAAIDGPVQPTPPTMRIDLAAPTGDFHGGASGVLYGLYGGGLPSNNLIDGINLRTVATKAQDGPQHPGADALEIVKPLADTSDGDVYIYMTDIYRGFPYQWPGSTGPERMADYKVKLAKQVDQVLSLPEQYQDNIVFVPFNEPEGNMFGTGQWSYNNISWLNNPQSYFAAWDEAYELIRAKMPDARIAGPNTSQLYNQVQGFLDHAVNAGTVPDVITWHELSDPAAIRRNVARYRAWEVTEFAGTAYAGTQLPINLDEYAFNYHTSVPGQMIQWISAIEDNKVDADIAYWNIDGNLSDSAVEANRGNGQWWLLNAYTQMSGKTVRVTPPSPNTSYTLQGVASLDSSKNQARAIFGGASGAARIRFENVPASLGSNVHALIQEIPWTGQIGDSREPRVIAETDVPVSAGSAIFNFGSVLPSFKESSAYQVILAPGAANTVPQSTTTLWEATYEAEAAGHTGSPYNVNGPEGSPSNVSKFYTSGGYNVGAWRTGSDLKLNFTVNVPQAGTYDLSVFANSLNTDAEVAQQGPTSVFLTVDGGAEQTLYLPLGYKWVVWDHADTKVNLSAGQHTISLSARSLNGSQGTIGDAIVDKIDLSLPNPAAAATVYEAELAELDGASVSYNRHSVSGSGVATLGAGDSATFWVYAADDAERALTLDTFGGGTAQLAVNGIVVGEIGATTTTKVFHHGGLNKVTVTGTSGSLVVDRLRAGDSDGASRRMSYEAENAARAGSVQVATYSLASGNQAVKDIGGAPGNNNSLTFTVNAAAAATHALTIRYSNPEQISATHYNPDTIARHADISINGGPTQRVMFPHSFHANSFWELTVPVELSQGANTIRFRSEELPNFDGITYASDDYPDVVMRSKWAPILDKISIAPYVVH